jgi:hypothetical protein
MAFRAGTVKSSRQGHAPGMRYWMLAPEQQLDRSGTAKFLNWLTGLTPKREGTMH